MSGSTILKNCRFGCTNILLEIHQALYFFAPTQKDDYPFAFLYIFVPNCPDVTGYTNMRSDRHMMQVSDEGACFTPLVFAATGSMGPTATTLFLGSFWLRSAILTTASAYSGYTLQTFAFHFCDVFKRSSLFCKTSY